MELDLIRFSSQEDDTIGLLFVNGDFECFTLEDEYRAEKKFGETRIDEGRYQIKLRTQGGMNEKYKKLYSWHRGMLWLQNVKNFEYIYIHPLNTEDETDGCIGVGVAVYANKYRNAALVQSVIAYERLYGPISNAILTGEDVFINIKTM